MADTGTGTDPSTDRCPDCGHLWERMCGCSCCGALLPDDDHSSDGSFRYPVNHWPPTAAEIRDAIARREAGK